MFRRIKISQVSLSLLLTSSLVGCGGGLSGDDDDNSAPTIQGSPQTQLEVGAAYSFTPSVSDPDEDDVTFSIANQPGWAQFNTSNGALTGTAVNNDVGDYSNIVISVSDGRATVSLASFDITVFSGGTPPPPPPPPPPATQPGQYLGFGNKTLGADSCPGNVTTYRVTSLSGGGGAGTLRDAVSQDCRNIVFDVGGNINLGDLQISSSYLTIDGSTAPDPGITLTNVGRIALEASGGIAVHDIIVNNIRAIGQGGSVEANDLWELDGSSGAPVYNIVLDHLTMSQSGDGSVDIYGDVYDVTLSHSFIFGSIQGHHFSQSSGLRERISIYGNVYARNNERQPRVRHETHQLDFVGNVIYGWGWFEGGATGMHIDAGTGTPTANVESNVYIHVPGMDGGADDALVVDNMAGSWFFNNNTWPTGENQGDSSSNSSKVSMVDQGVDFSTPREVPEVTAAGTHYPTQEEFDLLQTIAASVQGGGTQDPPNDPPPPPPPPPSGGPSAYRGIPEPSDILGFDVWANYAATQTISGSRGNDTIDCTGTASAPCVIDASNANFSRVDVTGSYVIFRGGVVNAPSGSGDFFSLYDCNYCVAKDVEVSGPGVDSGYSAAVRLGRNTVWLRGSIHGFGDNRNAAREQDFHGIKTDGDGPIWILEADIYDNSGDSVQVGDASRGASNNVYIGGGFFHDNRENGVDIKDSTNIVVSAVTMSGFSPTSSDPGSAIVVHDDAYNSKFYDNIILDTSIGIVSSGVDGHIMDGNTVTASSIGIQLRNTRNLVVSNNDITAPTPVQVQGGVTGDIQED